MLLGAIGILLNIYRQSYAHAAGENLSTADMLPAHG
jgi:hypothetical protein